MVQVIDTSVAVKWFVIETGREAALQILGEILDKPGAFAVPELFYFELMNVINHLISRPSKDQIKLMNQVLTVGIHRFSMTPDLALQIRRFQSLGLSGYDAAYVGLAKLIGGIWLSFDGKACAKIAHLKLSRLIV